MSSIKSIRAMNLCCNEMLLQRGYTKKLEPVIGIDTCAFYNPKSVAYCEDVCKANKREKFIVVYDKLKPVESKLNNAVYSSNEVRFNFSKNGERIVIFALNIDKVGVTKIQECVSLCMSLEIYRCIIIYNNSMSSMAKNIIKNGGMVDIEIFSDDELQINITKHDLVPLHEKLSSQECFDFKNKYGTKIPKITTSDPISRFYNFKEGDIIKITRKNGYVAYRIVIDI